MAFAPDEAVDLQRAFKKRDGGRGVGHKRERIQQNGDSGTRLACGEFLFGKGLTIEFRGNVTVADFFAVFRKGCERSGG